MTPLYDWLLAEASSVAPVDEVTMGLSWTSAVVAGRMGFAFSPSQAPRTLPWSGTLRGQGSDRLRPWLLSWNEAEAAVGLAVFNASHRMAGCLDEARALQLDVPGQLAVFAHFRSRLQGRRVVVIGRYPGLDRLWHDLPYSCLERRPGEQDLPDTAAEYLLPQADWVFLTASSLLNKTLPRLLELSAHAQVVLMGPSLPWLAGWQAYGVDYLAGVRVLDPVAARQVIAEGGGTRLFQGPVEYALLEFTA
ncbi:Rossmann-like domain-containing protein [Stutzerimonas tarimensis]|uniref:Rossmann-like domain-containing protein n=1 Tax=Stutzerimonas tarimensis TaxID=1507735 RepID=A0ABV7T7Y4_9GAMM